MAHKALLALPSGRAPGLDGWRPEELRLCLLLWASLCPSKPVTSVVKTGVQTVFPTVASDGSLTPTRPASPRGPLAMGGSPATLAGGVLDADFTTQRQSTLARAASDASSQKAYVMTSLSTLLAAFAGPDRVLDVATAATLAAHLACPCIASQPAAALASLHRNVLQRLVNMAPPEVAAVVPAAALRTAISADTLASLIAAQYASISAVAASNVSSGGTPSAVPPLGFCSLSSTTPEIAQARCGIISDGAALLVASVRKASLVPTLGDALHARPADSHVRSVADFPRIHNIIDCVDAHLMLTLPAHCVTVRACARTTVVCAPSAGCVLLDGLRGGQVYVAAKAVTIRNCMDTVVYLWSETPPAVLGETRGLRFAPYAVQYSSCRLDAKWAGLSVRGPGSALSPPSSSAAAALPVPGTVSVPAASMSSATVAAAAALEVDEANANQWSRVVAITPSRGSAAWDGVLSLRSSTSSAAAPTAAEAEQPVTSLPPSEWLIVGGMAMGSEAAPLGSLSWAGSAAATMLPVPADYAAAYSSRIAASARLQSALQSSSLSDSETSTVQAAVQAAFLVRFCVGTGHVRIRIVARYHTALYPACVSLLQDWLSTHEHRRVGDALRSIVTVDVSKK
ncbi:MAG: hypothetical protein EOO41_01410 [Methanobacteriota archaeon]|nr:MAG: hypothetical protein EOO41_01410 [Euryarchaeota archaeon]